MRRFVDRDMLMRYHWGLGVGHTYSHVRDHSEHTDKSIVPQGVHAQNLHDGDTLDHISSNASARMEPVDHDDELSLVNQDGFGLESDEMSGDESDDESRSEADFMMYEMYGSDWGSEDNLD